MTKKTEDIYTPLLAALARSLTRDVVKFTQGVMDQNRPRGAGAAGSTRSSALLCLPHADRAGRRRSRRGGRR